MHFNGHCSVLITTFVWLIFHRFYFFLLECMQRCIARTNKNHSKYTWWCLQEKRSTSTLVQPTNIQALRTSKTKSQSWKVTHTQQNNNNNDEYEKKNWKQKDQLTRFLLYFFYHLFYISGVHSLSVGFDFNFIAMMRTILISTGRKNKHARERESKHGNKKEGIRQRQ